MRWLSSSSSSSACAAFVTVVDFEVALVVLSLEICPVFVSCVCHPSCFGFLRFLFLFFLVFFPLLVLFLVSVKWVGW